MNTDALISQPALSSEGKPFARAGWLAIVMTLLYPLGMFTLIAAQIIKRIIHGSFYPNISFGDILSLLMTVATVYIYLQFKKLLNARYNYSGINQLITLSILWTILFQLESLGIQIGLLVMWPVPEKTIGLILATVVVFNLLTIGLINLFMGRRLISQKQKLGDLFRPFAYLTLIAGICNLSLILVPIGLILTPVISVIMGIIFLREKEEAEFI